METKLALITCIRETGAMFLASAAKNSILFALHASYQHKLLTDMLLFYASTFFIVRVTLHSGLVGGI